MPPPRKRRKAVGHEGEENIPVKDDVRAVKGGRRSTGKLSAFVELPLDILLEVSATSKSFTRNVTRIDFCLAQSIGSPTSGASQQGFSKGAHEQVDYMRMEIGALEP